MLKYKIKNVSLIEKLNIFSTLYKFSGTKLFERTGKNITKSNLLTKFIPLLILIISIINLMKMLLNINQYKFTLRYCLFFIINFTPHLIITLSITIFIFHESENIIEMIKNFDNVEEFFGKNDISKKLKNLYYVLMVLLIIYHFQYVYLDINYIISRVFWIQIEYFLIDVIEFQQNVWFIMVVIYLYNVNKILKNYNGEFRNTNKNECLNVLENVKKAQIHLTRNLKILCSNFWVTVIYF